MSPAAALASEVFRFYAAFVGALFAFKEFARATGLYRDWGMTGAAYAGIGLLLAGLDVPVVPVYLDGTHRAWPKGASLPRPHRVRMAIGRQRAYPHLERTKASALAICEDLHAAVLELSEGVTHDHDHRRRERDDAHSGALGRYRDLLPRLAPGRTDAPRRRPVSPRP